MDEQIPASVGDRVTIIYVSLPRYKGSAFKITHTVWIGSALPKTQQIQASTPETVDLRGRPIQSIKVGNIVTIQVEITNKDTATHTFTCLLQIKDVRNIVAHIACIRNMRLEVGASIVPGIGWIPQEEGTYTVEFFVWESLTNPIALSPVQRRTLSVSQ